MKSPKWVPSPVFILTGALWTTVAHAQTTPSVGPAFAAAYYPTGSAGSTGYPCPDSNGYAANVGGGHSGAAGPDSTWTFIYDIATGSSFIGTFAYVGSTGGGNTNEVVCGWRAGGGRERPAAWVGTSRSLSTPSRSTERSCKVRPL